MNLRGVVPVIALVAVMLWLSGCAGAGPAGTSGSTRARCTPSSQDEQRPLVLLFCVESP